MRCLFIVCCFLFVQQSMMFVASAGTDLDADGVFSEEDNDDFDMLIRNEHGGSREFSLSDSYVCEVSSVEQAMDLFYLLDGTDLLDFETCSRPSPSSDLSGQTQVISFSDNSTMRVSNGPTSEQSIPDFCVDSIYDNEIEDFLWIKLGQISSDQNPLVFCVTQGFSENQSCEMEMFSLFNETSRSEESYLEIACPTHGVDSNGAHQGIMGSSLGEFGDFNSDGLIDFVLGDYFESTCNFYLGVISNGSYALNQVNSDVTGCQGPLTAVDIDQDGNLDIVSSTKVLFLNNFTLVDSYNIPASFAPSSWQISIPFDYDSDGDLDVIVKKAYGILDGGNSVQTDVLTNLWEPDDDGDGYPNSVDLCLNTPDGLDVNSFGCASIEYDTDGDGVFDSFDICEGTFSNSSFISQDGCGWEQLDFDSDGVLNPFDECNGTQLNTSVNSVGCDSTAWDSDEDGIVDSDDFCPETDPVFRSSIGPNGCAWGELDDDLDGIKNSQDACQNTPVGETSDTRGCSWMTYDDDQDGVLNGQDECMNTYNSKHGEIDENGCWVGSDDGSSGIGFLIFIILGIILVVLLVSKSNRSDSDGISIDGMKVLSVAGKIAGGAAGVFTGMHQLQRGNIGGAFGSFSNAVKGNAPAINQSNDSAQTLANTGKSTYSCQNPACNYQFGNVSDAKMIGNTPERCPSCNTPVMKDMPWTGEKPVQNSISDLGKVTYACMQPTCAYEVGPVPKGTSVGRCMNCGGPMKKKSIY